MNTRANILQEKPFQPTAQNSKDLFNNKSRPVSGKSVSLSRPTSSGSQTQLRYIRPQSTKGNTPSKVIAVKSSSDNRTFQFGKPQQLNKKLNASFIEEFSQIDGIFFINNLALKGKYIGSTNINQKGIISIESVPYDSYLVEIEESKNFLHCALIVKFNSLPENHVLNKFIGLIPQTNSTPEIFVYYNKEQPKDPNDFSQMTLITGADVYLKRIIDNLGESTFDESSNNF